MLHWIQFLLPFLSTRLAPVVNPGLKLKSIWDHDKIRRFFVRGLDVNSTWFTVEKFFLFNPWYSISGIEKGLPCRRQMLKLMPFAFVCLWLLSMCAIFSLKSRFISSFALAVNLYELSTWSARGIQNWIIRTCVWNRLPEIRAKIGERMKFATARDRGAAVLHFPVRHRIKAREYKTRSIIST